MSDFTPFERDFTRALDEYLGPRKAVDARAITRAALLIPRAQRFHRPSPGAGRMAALGLVILTIVALIALAAGVGRDGRPSPMPSLPALTIVSPVPTGEIKPSETLLRTPPVSSSAPPSVSSSAPAPTQNPSILSLVAALPPGYECSSNGVEDWLPAGWESSSKVDCSRSGSHLVSYVLAGSRADLESLWSAATSGHQESGNDCSSGPGSQSLAPQGTLVGRLTCWKDSLGEIGMFTSDSLNVFGVFRDETGFGRWPAFFQSLLDIYPFPPGVLTPDQALLSHVPPLPAGWACNGGWTGIAGVTEVNCMSQPDGDGVSDHLSYVHANSNDVSTSVLDSKMPFLLNLSGQDCSVGPGSQDFGPHGSPIGGLDCWGGGSDRDGMLSSDALHILVFYEAASQTSWSGFYQFLVDAAPV